MSLKHLSFIFCAIVHFTFILKATSESMKKQPYEGVFIKNTGQWEGHILYLTQQQNLNIWITNTGVVYDYFEVYSDQNKLDFEFLFEKRHTPKMIIGHSIFLKNNYSVVSKYEELKPYIGSARFFKNTGDRPIQCYSEIYLYDVFQGIDQKWYFDNEKLRYDYIVAPNAKVNSIDIEVLGSDKFTVSNKNLVLNFGNIQLEHQDLYTYQWVGNQKSKIQTNWLLDKNHLKFQVADYDHSKPLIIDPIIWSTYIGSAMAGGMVFHTKKIKILENQAVILAGTTYSNTYPTTIGAYDTVFSGISNIYISKLSPDGKYIEFSTLLGGSHEDRITSIAVDNNEDIYILGATNSEDYPISNNAFQKINQTTDTTEDPKCPFLIKYTGCVTKLKNDGSEIIFSTFLGGNDDDGLAGIVVDNFGQSFIVGGSKSRDYPTTANAYMPSHSSNPDTNYCWNYDIVVSKLNAEGSGLIFSTFVGTSLDEVSYCIDVDNEGYPYFLGWGRSTNYPITDNAYRKSSIRHDTDHVHKVNLFATKLDTTGSSLIYSTYIGLGRAVAMQLDQDKNMIFSGFTDSGFVYPTTDGVFSQTQTGGEEIFVTKLNNSGSDLVFSTFISDRGDERPYGQDIDNAGNVYITGFTNSVNFPTTENAYSSERNGDNDDAFLTILDPEGKSLIYSSYFGGSGTDIGFSVKLDRNSGVVFSGLTNSSDFPISPDVFNTELSGASNFVTKISICDLVPTARYLEVVDNRLTVVQNGATYQWLDCDNDFSPLEGENSRILSLTNGNFACIINFNGCVDTTSCFSIDLSSIQKTNNLPTWSFYPNPVSKYFFIHNDNYAVYQISDIFGRVVIEFEKLPNNQTVYEVNLPKGMYILNNVTDQTFKRMIINR
jgi:hypothetical protein